MSEFFDWRVMGMHFYGRLGRALRVLAKPFTYLNTIPDLSGVPEPCVFVGRHRNLRGPIFTLMHLPREVHPWVYNVFCDADSCYKQYTNYTLSVRMNWRGHRGSLAAWIMSRFVPSLVKNIGGIPVYRKSIQVKKTFRLSMEALLRGESVIIYPDIDYTSTDDMPGQIYTGFLLLGKLYRKDTGKNLSFVPVDVNMKRRAMTMGAPIVFDGKRPYEPERARVAAAILSEFERIGTAQV